MLLPCTAMALRRVCAALCAMALCAGCADGVYADSVSNELERGGPEPVIVTLGGFTSCASAPQGPTPAGTARWERAARLSQRFSRGDARWVRGCFDAASQLHWVSSSAPGVVRSTTVDDLVPFFNAVAERVGDPRRPLYVIGHSYGGWVAAHTAARFAPSANLRLLFTVDPISPNDCTVGSYLRAAASPVTAPWSLAGCQRAPADLSLSDRARIVDHVPERAWRHYYQRNFIPLRSSPFEGAPQPHRSFDVSPLLTRNGGAHPSWNAHVGIDELSLVWYSFEASIEHDLSAP